MKKSLLTLLAFLAIYIAGFTQALTGTKTIGVEYPTVAAAIADLNFNGAGTGGVIFNVPAGYTETFTTAQAGYITTLTGSATNPVTFQRSGTGADPLITAPTGTGTLDAIIAIAGCDYVTFDGIDLQENSANNNVTTKMEFGYAILRASVNTVTDGSQNITIRNCTITLNTTLTVTTTGIYSADHTISSATALPVTTAAGTNSNLKIYNNTLTTCYFGIVLNGYAAVSPFTYYDQNNEIGKDGANHLSNIGGGGAASYGIYTTYQNNLKVANNMLTGTTSGTRNFYGIYLSTASNASYDLYNNTVTMNFTPTDVGGNGNFYAINCDMGASGTTNVVNIYNNTVTGCNFTTAYAQAGANLMNITNMGFTTNIYGNVVSNNTIGNGATGVAAIGAIKYMWFQKAGSGGTLVVHDNSVTGNARIQPASTPGSGTTYFIAVAGSGATLNAYNNLVDNNIISTTNGSAYGLYIIYADASGKNVYHNTITNLTEANGSTNGIYNSGGTLGKFYDNTIRKITGSPITARGQYANITGIYHSTGTSMYYYNNMISELSCPATLSLVGYDYNNLNGIFIESGGTTKGFYNNTIYLNSTNNAATFGSSAICAMSLTGVDLRNNILVNNSVSAGSNGKTVCLRLRNSNTSYTNFNSNYNDLNAGTPGSSNYIYYYGVGGTYAGTQTLAAYKTLMTPIDLQSVSEIPPFVNVSNSPYDVHLQTNVNTQCEAGGYVVSTPFAITDDIDGNPRFPNAGYPVNPSFNPNAPDIGADEFGGLSTDNIPPAIVYTPFAETSSKAARTLYAKITDGNGVPTSGTGLPVLYWNLNGGSWQAVTGTWVADSARYSFTFGAANAYHDVVSYYIVAQDMASPVNVGAFPWMGANGFTSDPPVCSTPPATPSSYLIIQAIFGTKHIGAGKDYATLTDAVTDLNDKFMSAPVIFLLDDNTYPAVTSPIHLDVNPGNVNATRTLTIKPNTGATPVISGSMDNTGLIIMNGLDYVTVDGSNTTGGTTKDLTFENSSCTAGAYTFGITNNGGTNPSTNITLKNCTLKGSINTWRVDDYVIVFNENGGTTGGGYDNCVITNNTIKKAKYGIAVLASASKMNQNLVISNNVIGSANPTEYINRWGIDIENSNNTTITGNDIMGPANGDSLDVQFGIYYWNGSTNTKITKNKIHDWFSLFNGSSGIKCGNQGQSTTTEISNNLIYNIKCYGMNPGTGQNIAYGILVRDGGNMNIWNNTIYLSGPYLDGFDSYGPSSGCIGFMEWTTTGFDVRDNILRNAMTNPNPNASGSSGRAYGIMIAALTAADATAHFTNLNYNDYYIDGYKGAIAQWYGTGGISMTDYPTLPEWQAFTGKEALSITENPKFVTELDLHPTSVSLNSVGGTKQVPTDYDNKSRYNPCDMGAYEWSNLINPTDYHTLAATAITKNSATLTADMNTNGEVVETYLQWGVDLTYGNYANPVGWGNPAKVRTVTLTALNAPITGLTPNTTYHCQIIGFPGTSTQSQLFGNDMTFTTLPLPPTVVTTAATAVTVTGATLNGTVNANGVSTAASFEYGLTTGYGSTVTATPPTVTGSTVTPVTATLTTLEPNTLYHYRAVGVNTGGTGTGSDMTFTTPPLPPAVVTYAASAVSSTGATLNGTVNANDASTTVTFEYGLTTGYGSTSAAIQSPVTGHTVTPVNTILAGLEPNTLYHFRVVGVSAGGTIYGADLTFTTSLLQPDVVTMSATGITTTGAKLNGTVDANNSPSTVSFDYGLTATYGSIVTATPGSVTGNTPVPVYAVITGLLPNTLYHYQVIAYNSGGMTFGNDLTFTTPPLPPAVVTTAASAVTSTLATLNGTVNANDATTAVSFDYGLTVAYGTNVAANPASVTGSTTTGVTADITGLLPQTIYHFRAVGANAGGTAYGDDMIFTTGIPETLTVTGEISAQTCYNAIQTITVAGTPETFVVKPTGNVTLIAGQNIIFLPGTTVEPGGYLDGRITTTNEYCGVVAAPIPAARMADVAIPVTSSPTSDFRVYPNPTTGAFTLEFNNETETGKSNVEIFSMRGEKVYDTELSGNGKHELSISDKPVGIYVIRIISGSKTETARIIKQ